MADLQLPVTVEYVSTKEAHEIQMRLLYGDFYTRLREHERGTIIMFLFLSLTGMFAAAMSGRTGLFLVITAGSVAIGKKLWTEYKSAVRAADNMVGRGVGKSLRIEINDRGFVEHDQGIESFCPWSAMKYCCVRDGVLFVELANGLWAIVPAATLKPKEVTLEQIEEVLLRNGVAQPR